MLNIKKKKKEDDIVTRKITRYRVRHNGWDFRDDPVRKLYCVCSYIHVKLLFT